MPRFSVVIPAYNASRTIGETIRSVLAQSEPDFELIVVDDGSADDTPAIVESFASDRRLSLLRQENQGVAAARNTGIALARANFVMSSATVRRDVLGEVGGFDASIRGTDDYDLWMRILLGGHTAVRAGAAPLLLQRGRADSQSKDERVV